MAGLPKTVGTTIDNLYSLREKRMALQREADKIKKQERELTDHAVTLCRKARVDKASGKLATFSHGLKSIAVVEDWEEFHAFVEDNDAWDCVQKRLNQKAILDRIEDGVTIEGITTENVITTALRKAG